MSDFIASTLAAGGGGTGGGLIAKASTAGGVVYLTTWALRESHVLVTLIRRGHQAARGEQQEINDEEFKL